MNVCQLIQSLIDYAEKNEIISAEDELVVRNQLMEIMQIYEWNENSGADFTSIDALLDALVNNACERNIISDTAALRDLFDTKIMGVLTMAPREVNRIFCEKYAVSPEAATNWYYNYSRKINYVRAGRIAKNLKWKYDSEYGMLDITINKSKPEKDSRDIAAAGAVKSVNYPKCQLCPENTGFAGNMHHPARQNLRPVTVQIHNEEWQLQYSPYGYYNEHCILFNKRHTPMVIDREVFEKLFDAVDMFPHYFFGSNADLPIVGGSILNHEHFQGGRYTFAMEKAPVETKFEMSEYPEVSAGILKWKMSVIRLSSENREQMTNACTKILNEWRNYNDESVGIISETDGMPHNTITPIARKNRTAYVCDLVLRNNRTSQERPLGIFHPNPELHHIKKENIGLIEVMGLAVLPSRLESEMASLKTEMLTGKITESDHAEWAKNVLERNKNFDNDNADSIIRYEIGSVFEQVLADAGVFKREAKGIEAFQRFIELIKRC